MATEHNLNVNLKDLLSQADTLFVPPEIKEGLESKTGESNYYICRFKGLQRSTKYYTARSHFAKSAR